MGILTNYEARYFLKNVKVPYETDVLWRYIDGGIMYHLLVGHNDNVKICFLIGSGEGPLRSPKTHEIV